MQINDLLGILPTNISEEQISLIKRDCLNFIEQSQGLPLVKSISSHYEDFQKIKLRHKKTTSAFSQSFNYALGEGKLRERALFINSTLEENTESFFIFPTNNFKFLYNNTIKDSKHSHEDLYNSLVEYFNNDVQSIFTDTLQATYSNDNLEEAISNECEIIIYNIPYYYAIRCSMINYSELIQFLQ